VRVLILNERDPRHPKAGGAEIHVAEIFDRLAARGISVTQFACGFPDASDREDVGGLHVERLGGIPAYYARAAIACARQTHRDRFDVVVECLNKMPFLAPAYSGVPVLALCHHLFGETAFEQVAWPIAAAVWSVERLIPRLYRSARFVVISESTRDDLARRGVDADCIEVHHPGIRHPALTPLPVEARGHGVVYLGRLERYKNVDLLLRAMAALSSRFPEAQLTIIGEGSERAHLETLASELGIADRTCFAGFVTDARRDEILAAARVCVCPSTKEGWGLTVIESNAVGTPNVASDAPGLRDSVRDGETGFLVPVGDVAGFTDRIGTLLGDDAIASRLSRAASAWALHFEWDRAAEQMEAALESARHGRIR